MKIKDGMESYNIFMRKKGGQLKESLTFRLFVHPKLEKYR
jgi:hypothetical protein